MNPLADFFTRNLTLIYFLYGLGFFSMGLAVALEGNRASDVRLRHALRPLALFGLVHGAHEWIEMFALMDLLPGHAVAPLAWEAARLAILALSFLTLAAFGASLVSPSQSLRRLSLAIPLSLALVWAVGLLTMQGNYPAAEEWSVADVWTRYVLAVPAALLASAGLTAQQRVFRQAGLIRFGQDSLWAAAAFVLYGLVGQTFTRSSPLPPSTVINQELFLRLFGFPVQLLRAAAAVTVAVAMMRFLRSFEVETQRQIAGLQAARLQEAERREAWRGELLRRVVEAQETERERIARELHDETGQALIAIGLGLRGAAAALPPDPVKAAHNLRQLESLVSHSLDELQRLIADLRPSHLDDLGLPAALRWYAGQVQQRTPLTVNVEIAGESRPLPSAVATALFRVAQEALTNTVKHARATSARARLTFGEAAVALQIEDDGEGFDPGILANPAHPTWGLLGMEERASLLGGRFALRSRPGQGTRVEVTIPYHAEADRHADTPASGG